jgi:hypothetical protein
MPFIALLPRRTNLVSATPDSAQGTGQISNSIETVAAVYIPGGWDVNIEDERQRRAVDFQAMPHPGGDEKPVSHRRG